MKTLIYGGTDFIGTSLILELLKNNTEVRVIVNSFEKVKFLPDGVETIIAYSERPLSLKKAFQGMDTLYISSMPSRNEAENVLNLLAQAVVSGVRKIVLQSVYKADEIKDIPFFQVKREIERASSIVV
jgi:uncharacterized protein YbjT (DUF2867 family)